MEQFVWSMEEEPVKDMFRYVLMESGDMCVDMTGLLAMQELFVANWDTLQQVQNHRITTIMYLFSTPVYRYSYSLFTGAAPQPIVYDRLTCSGSEQTLSACSKNTYYSSCPITSIGGAVCEGINLGIFSVNHSFCFLIMYSIHKLHF